MLGLLLLHGLKIQSVRQRVKAPRVATSWRLLKTLRRLYVLVAATTERCARCMLWLAGCSCTLAAGGALIAGL